MPHSHHIPAMPSPQQFGAPCFFGGHDFIALADRALFWPKHSALIVADLHFEKGSAFAAHGQHLPPYDSHDTLQRLEILAETTGAHQIFCLGDSFHDHKAASRMAADVSERLCNLAAERHILWLACNHDGISGSAWGGEVADELPLDGIVLRHESVKGEARPEISGHFHPKLRLRLRGRLLSRPCFLASEDRLLMPAFGSLTGGMDADSFEISRLFSRKDYRALLPAGK
jgi:DNA ligase-associated metallophosphoesterase